MVPPSRACKNALFSQCCVPARFKKKNTLGPCKKHYFMFFAPAVSMLFLAPGEGEEKVKVHDPPTNPNF